MTVTGKTMAENIKGCINKNTDIIRPIDQPYSETGGIAVLKGNLAPDRCVVKRSAVAKEMLVHKREETPAKRVTDGKLESVSSSQLKKGDVFECEAGDVIPADGEIIEGLASIDESAITGESAPVIRQSHSAFSAG